MSKPIHVQIIEKARDLLSDEKKWCRGEVALDGGGAPVSATDDTASKWCAYGALVVTAHHMTRGTSQTFDLTDAAVGFFGGCDALMKVNDRMGHTTVVALFDEVIGRFS